MTTPSSDAATRPSVSVVIPTIGRKNLNYLLDELDRQLPSDVEVVIVDDRSANFATLEMVPRANTRVIAGRGAGPAAARNAGWRGSRGDWIAFLDEDVLVTSTWYADLCRDLAEQPARVAGVQGRVTAPLVAGVPVEDGMADTARLGGAAWITADMAYRRSALALVRGFDERFPRAYREDSDLAFRVRAQAGELVLGERVTERSARDDPHWACLRAQRGNADDALLRRRYGRGWRGLLGIGPGRLGRHAVAVGGAAIALVCLAVPRRSARLVGMAGAAVTAAATVEFVLTRLRSAPGERAHLGRLVGSSLLIPPLAVGHRAYGWWRARRVAPWVSVSNNNKS